MYVWKNKTIKRNALILLAVLFPWTTRASLPIGVTNLSLGDPIVLFIGLLLLFGTFPVVSFPSYSKEIFAFLIVSILSVIVALFISPELTDPSDSIVSILKLASSVSYFVSIIVLTCNNTNDRVYEFLFVTTIVGGLISVFTLFRLTIGYYRPTGSFNNPNIYADYLLFSFFSLLYINHEFELRSKIKNRMKLVFLVLGISMITSVLATQSRSGIGALLISGIFLMILRNRSYINYLFKHIKRNTVVVIGLSIPTGILLLKLARPVIYRYQSLIGGNSTGGRFERWVQSVRIVSEYPVFGVGWGQHLNYIDSTIHLHNTLAQVAVETGLIGFVIYIAIIMFAIRKGIQLSVTESIPGASYLTAFLLASVLNSVFHNTINFRTFWIVLGLIGSLVIHYSRSTAESRI